MTVPTSSIWNSVAGSFRQPRASRDTKLHIGTTLRDLYRADAKPKPDFDGLLDQLEKVEDGKF